MVVIICHYPKPRDCRKGSSNNLKPANMMYHVQESKTKTGKVFVKPPPQRTLS